MEQSRRSILLQRIIPGRNETRQVPARETSTVTYHLFIKQKIIEVLKEAICNSVPKEMLSAKRKLITSIA